MINLRNKERWIKNELRKCFYPHVITFEDRRDVIEIRFFNYEKAIETLDLDKYFLDRYNAFMNKYLFGLDLLFKAITSHKYSVNNEQNRCVLESQLQAILNQYQSDNNIDLFEEFYRMINIKE